MARTGWNAGRGPGDITRAARVWRVSLTAVWLVYLVEPVSGLFGHHRDALYIAGGMAIIAAFCVIFVAMIADWNRTTRRSMLGLAALFALALVACSVYGGGGATSLWIYVSALVGLVIPVQRTGGGHQRDPPLRRAELPRQPHPPGRRPLP